MIFKKRCLELCVYFFMIASYFCMQKYIGSTGWLTFIFNILFAVCSFYASELIANLLVNKTKTTVLIKVYKH